MQGNLAQSLGRHDHDEHVVASHVGDGGLRSVEVDDGVERHTDVDRLAEAPRAEGVGHVRGGVKDLGPVLEDFEPALVLQVVVAVDGQGNRVVEHIIHVCRQPVALAVLDQEETDTVRGLRRGGCSWEFPVAANLEITERQTTPDTLVWIKPLLDEVKGSDDVLPPRCGATGEIDLVPLEFANAHAGDGVEPAVHSRTAKGARNITDHPGPDSPPLLVNGVAASESPPHRARHSGLPRAKDAKRVASV